MVEPALCELDETLPANVALFGIARWPEALAGDPAAAIAVALACRGAARDDEDPRLRLAVAALGRCAHDSAARLVLLHLKPREGSR